MPTPFGEGESLTVGQILQDPDLLEGMNPSDLLAALGGVPPGFTVAAGKGVSIAPGWKIATNQDGIQIRWSAGSMRLGHSAEPYWRFSSGQTGKSVRFRRDNGTDRRSTPERAATRAAAGAMTAPARSLLPVPAAVRAMTCSEWR
jgi:hypothetical protein